MVRSLGVCSVTSYLRRGDEFYAPDEADLSRSVHRTLLRGGRASIFLWAVKVATPKETTADEHRVALVPDTATRLKAAGLDVGVEAGAGAAAYISDEAYLQAADAVLKVQAPSVPEVDLLRSGAVLISFLQPATQGDAVRALAKRGVTAFSLELLPRISRAQSMDALSSQASAAGYKAVLMAAGRIGK